MGLLKHSDSRHVVYGIKTCYVKLSHLIKLYTVSLSIFLPSFTSPSGVRPSVERR